MNRWDPHGCPGRYLDRDSQLRARTTDGYHAGRDTQPPGQDLDCSCRRSRLAVNTSSRYLSLEATDEVIRRSEDEAKTKAARVGNAVFVGPHPGRVKDDLVLSSYIEEAEDEL